VASSRCHLRATAGACRSFAASLYGLPLPLPNGSVFHVGAVLLVMFNKAALSSYKFPYANIITLLQVT
jgi:hypothetical protein